MPDQSILARVTAVDMGDEERFYILCGEVFAGEYSDKKDADLFCSDMNAAASAWLDREIDSIHKSVIQKLKKAGVGGLARLQVTLAFQKVIRSAPGKEIKPCPNDCDGSSHPGQWHAKWDFPTTTPRQENGGS